MSFLPVLGHKESIVIWQQSELRVHGDPYSVSLQECTPLVTMTSNFAEFRTEGMKNTEISSGHCE